MRLLSVVALTLLFLAGAACVTAQSIDLRSYQDETYAVKATIGTALKDQPNQEFYLAVDAFGSETKVAAVDCWQCCDKAAYDASLSSSNKGSCKALPDGADGSKTEACTDVFQSGTLTFPGAPFTEVTSSPVGSAFLSLPSDGIVGLADKVHGFYFARTCSNDIAKGGSIMVGAFDTDSCDATKLTTLPLTTSTDNNNALSTELSKYQVGDENEVIPVAPTTWYATFTTASPNIIIPKASIGWVRKFMARHGFTLRRRTTTCQKPPEHYKEKVVRFIRYVVELRKAQNFAFISAADETAIAMDGDGGLTIEEKGIKEVRDLSFYHCHCSETTSFTASNRTNRFRPDALHWTRPAFSTELQLKTALVLDDDDAMLLDVSDSEGGEDSGSDH